MVKTRKNLTKLSQMLIDEQDRRDLRDRQVADEIGVIQQTYSTWKHGSIPSRAWYENICEFLNIPISELLDLIENAKVSVGNHNIPQLSDFSRAPAYGVVTSKETGEFYFEPVNAGRKSIPAGRYIFFADTPVMEPAIRDGATCWIDNTIWPAPGNDVVVHIEDGGAVIGQLVSTSAKGVKLRQLNPERTFDVADVKAIHTIVLTQRVVS